MPEEHYHPKIKSSVKGGVLTDRFIFEVDPGRNLESVNFAAQIDRIVRPHEETRVFHTYLSLMFLTMAYLMLFCTEIYRIIDRSRIK